MTLLRQIRNLCSALCVFAALTGPVEAQQRIQVGDLIQRIDRLEKEVTRLRVSPGGSSDSVRLDLIEQELRRLTGIIERLEFESGRAASANTKRIEEFEKRLTELEKAESTRLSTATVLPSPPAPSIPPVLTTESSFAIATVPPATGVDGYAPTVQVAPGFQTSPDPLATQGIAPVAIQGSIQNADVLYDEGIRLLNIGSFDQAGARFEDLIANHPGDPKAGQAQFWLGDMHFKLGRYEQAATAFLDSFRNWPDGPKAPDSLLKLGMTLANIGKTEEACLSFKQVPARYPGSPATLLRRADIESQRYRCVN